MAERVELEALVPPDLHGNRFDQVAAQLFPDYSRSRLKAWIQSGELTVDSQVLRPRDKVLGGARLVLSAELADEVSWEPELIELDILHADNAIIVLNKPAGLVVHPAAGHAGGTLVNALLARFPELAQLPRGGIVHRLDMETSGLLVVARTLAAHNQLVAQLQDRSVKREYAAVCIGRMTGGGTVDAPIGRHPRQRKKMAVVATGGKEAVTHYRVEQRYGHHTCIAVQLETGRTHQIRVHMAYRHHPLVGDPVYGGRPRLPVGASAELIEGLRGFRRQALHARKLALTHPAHGERVEFECPLPDDMTYLLELLAAEDPPP